jgi:two-component system, chemotaxis family, protein-glutamate methylesterase/glutaminase
MTIKVLVVDDSFVIRKILASELNKLPGIVVVATAADAYEARDLIASCSPDVLTLDIDMPRVDGINFLQKLMRHHPIPVVIVSSITPEGSDVALRALALGAVDVVGKPSSQHSVPDVAGRLASAIRAASVAKLRRADDGPRRGTSCRLGSATAGRLVCIGSSTGGTRALEETLSSLPDDAPPIAVVQHMPAEFTGPLARRLASLTRLDVREAVAGDVVVPGVVVIAPGGHHLKVRPSGDHLVLAVEGGDAVNYHRPSVDVLFGSAASLPKTEVLGVLLTGMGSDGARGLLALKQGGAHTIAQDEATSVVWGMPRVAVEMGAAEEVLPLGRIAPAIVKWASRSRVARAS